jgi:hypothetical protein
MATAVETINFMARYYFKNAVPVSTLGSRIVADQQRRWATSYGLSWITCAQLEFRKFSKMVYIRTGQKE